jgi:DNA-binding protein HU-beta
MTKAELIDRIARSARSNDLPPEVTKKVIVKILDLAFAELSAFFVRSRVTRSTIPRFTYPKFGTFTKKQRSGRRGVNPRTLEPMDIEACETVDFKPSVELKRQLNEVSATSKTKTKTSAKAKAKAKTGRKKKAARSTAKAKTSSKSATKRKQAGSGSGAGSGAGAGAGVGFGRRKLVTREEVELEPPPTKPLLPDAPLQKVARRKRTPLDDTGS